MEKLLESYKCASVAVLWELPPQLKCRDVFKKHNKVEMRLNLWELLYFKLLKIIFFNFRNFEQVLCKILVYTINCKSSYKNRLFVNIK